MEIDYFKEENELTKKLFDLDEIISFQMAREPEYWHSGSYWGELYTEDEIIEELNKGG